MPKCFERILKYNYGEKSLNAPFAIYLDLEFLLKKNNLVIIILIIIIIIKIILKNLTQRKKLNMSLVGHCLQKVHSMKKKINLIITEEKTMSKRYVIYAKGSLVWIKMMRIIKLEKSLKTTVITQENLEQLLIANAT